MTTNEQAEQTHFRNVVIDADGLVTGEHDRYSGWMHFTGYVDGLLVHEVWLNGGPQARAALWQVQDGYGTPGFVPTQGHDWSGIRDSSEAAWADLVAVAERFLHRDEFMRRLTSEPLTQEDEDLLADLGYGGAL